MANLSDFLQPLEGMQYIDEVNVTSSVAIVDVTGMDSTFDAYLIVATGVVGDTSTFLIKARAIVSGLADTTNNYIVDFKSQNSTTSTAWGIGRVTDFLNDANSSATIRMLIYRPTQSSYKTAESVYIASVPTLEHQASGHAFTKTDAVDGVQFFEDAGDSFTAGTFRLYGMKN